MRVLCWNVRGLGAKSKQSVIRKTISRNKVEMVFLQETTKEEILELEVGRLWYDDNFRFVMAPSSGKSGGLITIWDVSKFKVEHS
ncbi:hypothetical protein V6N13_076722 [Hibiscus sabdariffa]|uniref:Uncharacterized protein n=2 Tax=Hibiscus sabdariffa TaxID=183260 RepID=A0ABR2N782_9ROSI